MIPLLQNDYYKYSRMFRGNYKKGASLFKSLLKNPNVKDELLESLPALAAVFTDFNNSEAEGLCYDILMKEGLLETATMKYLKGLGKTSYTSFSTLCNSTSQLMTIFRDKTLDPILQNNDAAMKTFLKKKSVCKALGQNANTDIMMTENKLKSLSKCMPYSEENLYSSLNTYWSSIDNTTTPFASTELYYSYTPAYEWAVVSEGNNCIFLPVSLRTKLSTSSTYYYYPAVFYYNISTKSWKFLYAASTSVKQTNNNNNSRQALGLAYDKNNNRLYIFYKPSSTSAQMCCDMIYGTSGSVYKTGISLATIGSTSYGAPYFCTFDSSNSYAKFVWDVAAVTIGSTDTYGWLYGVSVNTSGTVSWNGKVAHPSNQYSPYYTASAISAGVRSNLRNQKYAVCAMIAKTSDSRAENVICSIESYGSSYRTRFIPAFATSLSSIISPNGSAISKGGIAIFTYDSIYYGSSSQRVYMAIDLVNGTCTRLFSIGSGSYSIYAAPYFDKVAVKHSKEDAKFYIYGFNSSNKGQEYVFNEQPSLFRLGAVQERGADKYKLKFTSTSSLLLLNYEGGLT